MWRQSIIFRTLWEKLKEKIKEAEAAFAAEVEKLKADHKNRVLLAEQQMREDIADSHNRLQQETDSALEKHVGTVLDSVVHR